MSSIAHLSCYQGVGETFELLADSCSSRINNLVKLLKNNTPRIQILLEDASFGSDLTPEARLIIASMVVCQGSMYDNGSWFSEINMCQAFQIKIKEYLCALMQLETKGYIMTFYQYRMSDGRVLLVRYQPGAINKRNILRPAGVSRVKLPDYIIWMEAPSETAQLPYGDVISKEVIDKMRCPNIIREHFEEEKRVSITDKISDHHHETDINDDDVFTPSANSTQTTTNSPFADIISVFDSLDKSPQTEGSQSAKAVTVKAFNSVPATVKHRRTDRRWVTAKSYLANPAALARELHELAVSEELDPRAIKAAEHNLLKYFSDHPDMALSNAKRYLTSALQNAVLTMSDIKAQRCKDNAYGAIRKNSSVKYYADFALLEEQLLDS